MDRILTTALMNNAALLLALSVIYETGYFLPPKYQRKRPIINGLLIAFICVLIMSVPFTLMPGVVFDTRSILISVTALTFGMVPTAITAIIAIILRIVQSGTGTVTGIAVIISSALIGLAWKNYIFPKFKDRRWLSIYIMSITVHTVMLACMLLLPYPDNLNVIGQIAIPVLIIYPVAALLLSLLLIRQQEHRQYQEQLKESEEKYRRLFETMTPGVVYQAADGKIISANPAAERILGLTFEQMKGRTSMDDAWRSLREDGSILPGSEHPAMIALRTGRKIGPVVFSIFQPQINDHVWLSVNAIPLFQSGETKPYQVYVTIDDVTAERKASQNFKLLFNKMIDAFALHEIICDDKGKPIDYKFLAVNPTFENLAGKKAADIIGKKVLEIFPDTEQRWIEIYGRVALTGEPAEFIDYSVGLDKHFEVSAYQPAQNQFACTFSDITKRVRAEAKYSSYIANAPYGIFVIDENGQFIEANHVMLTMTGYSSIELPQMNIKDIAGKELSESILQRFKTLKENGVFSVTLKYKDYNGNIRDATADTVKLSDTRFLCFAVDITDRRKSEDDLIYSLNHDYLTGLYNRKYFDETMLRVNKTEYFPLSLIIADINGVRIINDTFGYADGDKLIIETSKILAGCCRAGDILARTGGDEFAIILPNTDNDTAYEILKSINNMCKITNENNKDRIYEINLSIGFSTKENNDDTADISKTAEIYLRNKKLLNSKSIRNDLIASMMATVYEKNHDTRDHANRTAVLAVKTGEKLNLPQKNLGELELLSILHDIGKIIIDDSILKKPGKLTEDEWRIMKTHSEVGYRIAKATSELEPIAEYILTHHERWDGKGYPYGLAAETIPLLSRIIAVIDAYDAMTNDRVYRKAMTQETAIEELKINAGIQFDPHIVDVFINILAEQCLTENQEEKS